jgi:hypothetical protein
MMVAMDAIEKAHEWDASITFFAFDIPIPGSVRYALQHCSRSIFSSLAVVPRHRSIPIVSAVSSVVTFSH